MEEKICLFNEGCRYLVKENKPFAKIIIEVEVVEITNSGFVKFKTSAGTVFWARYNEYKILEQLSKIQRPPRLLQED